MFLDDQEHRHRTFAKRYPQDEIFPVYTADSAINQLKENSPFDLVFLDHDLGGFYMPSDKVSGFEVARHIAEMEESLHPKKVIVHSWNESAAMRMVEVLNDAGLSVSYEPFS